MNTKQPRRIIYFLGMALIIWLILGLIGCGQTIPTLKIVSISITPPVPAQLLVGTNTSLYAVATYTDGSTSGIVLGVTWTSDNTSVATVDAGTVTGIADGTANIEASFFRNNQRPGPTNGGNLVLHRRNSIFPQ